MVESVGKGVERSLKYFDEEGPEGMGRLTFTSGAHIVAASVHPLVTEHKMILFCSYSVVLKPISLENFV